MEAAILAGIKKGKKPKAIIAVHLYGMPYDVTRVNGIAERYGIPVLEDSAEALGSTWNGAHCGTFGDIGVLSFNGNKIITTSGGGPWSPRTRRSRKKRFSWPHKPAMTPHIINIAI